MQVGSEDHSYVVAVVLHTQNLAPRGPGRTAIVHFVGDDKPWAAHYDALMAAAGTSEKKKKKSTKHLIPERLVRTWRAACPTTRGP